MALFVFWQLIKQLTTAPDYRWEITPGHKPASHVPLAWMVREAIHAGLNFDAEKVVAMGCSDVLEDQGAAAPPAADTAYTDFASAVPDICVTNGRQQPNGGSSSSAVVAAPEEETNGHDDETTPRSHFHDMMHRAHVARLHDSLLYSCGLGFASVTSWRLMEYLPFRRMDLQADGTWKPIRWPLPCGEVRDVPDNARVHGSVIRRMRLDASYRPGNLIIGGGGRGCRVAPDEYGTGEWQCIKDEGDPVGELWVKARPDQDG